MVELKKQNYSSNKKLYEKVLKILREKLDIKIPIEQVGSTAIKNMYGKNIIDILIGAENNDEFEKIREKLEEVGFIPSKKSSDNIYQFFASTEKETKDGDVHIHLVIKETERYKEFIILKNYLIKNKDEAKSYSDFKKKLINSGITDRKEYKRTKSEYVSALLERAKKDYYNE